MIAWEIAAVTASAIMIAIYFHKWHKAVTHQPLMTMRGTMQQVRRSWVSAQMGKGMLPVNTLRDIIGSAQWFASSALLVAVGACGFLASTDSAVSKNGLLHIKVVGLVAACVLAFIFFMHSTRYYSHVSFLINTPDIAGTPVTEELVYRVVSRAATMWSHGMKVQICVALPMLMWVLGPVYLVIATILTIIVMHALDFETVSFEVALQGQASMSSTNASSDTVPMNRPESGL